MQHAALTDFFNGLNRFQSQIAELNQTQDNLTQKVAAIKQEIANSADFQTACLSENSLKGKITRLTAAVQTALAGWENALEQALPMKKLSERFGDKIIFLVFGKVNAGKSSFVNQVVQMYEELFPNEVVQHFYLDTELDEIKPHIGKFAEGFTETTAQIQGVELGKNFVLLDSPGLHSVVEKNGNLTKQFIDSADAVLWLTPSASPGQVQELQDLKIELEKGKPLMPVITRSDVVEEEWSEEKQDVVAVYVDKTATNRSLQENDVKARLGDFNGVRTEQIKEPVSISVFTYKLHQNLEQAGLARLFSQLAGLINEAAGYKGSKADNQMKNFVRENIISKLQQIQDQHLQPVVDEAKQTLDDLKFSQANIANNVQLEAFNAVPRIVNKYKNSHDKTAIVTELNEVMTRRLNQILQEKLSRFVANIDRVSTDLDDDELSDFSDITVAVEKVKGGTVKATSKAAGVGIGMVIGGLVGGPAGIFLGSVIGGWFGGKAGKIFVETETDYEVVGVSSAELEADLRTAIEQNISSIVASVIKEVEKQLAPLLNTCEQLRHSIDQIKQEFI